MINSTTESEDNSKIVASRLIEQACKKHYTNLNQNLEKAISKDDYGRVVQDNTIVEVDRFLNRLQFSVRKLGIRDARNIVLQEVLKIRRSQPEIKPPPSDGIAFEHWCADQIRALGWAALVSKASGDQGVDIRASKDGTIVAIQCKRYSQPVGNKAVQEVFAGKAHIKANKACVVSTGGFTDAARKLAATTGVYLIHSDQLSNFSNIVNGVSGVLGRST